MRREEGTGAVPLRGAGSELEFRLRFVKNVREDPELKPPSFISPSHPQHWLPEGSREGRAGRSSEPWGARDRGEGAGLHPTSPEGKGGISSHLC